MTPLQTHRSGRPRGLIAPQRFRLDGQVSPVLSDRERHTLGEVERRTTAEDPDFASTLRKGQEQLHTPGDGLDHALFAPMALLVVILLLMGQLTAAVIIGFVAAGVGWLTAGHARTEAHR